MKSCSKSSYKFLMYAWWGYTKAVVIKFLIAHYPNANFQGKNGSILDVVFFFFNKEILNAFPTIAGGAKESYNKCWW